MNRQPPAPPRSVENILAHRYWLTEKGWEATEQNAAKISLTDKGLAATDPLDPGELS